MERKVTSRYRINRFSFPSSSHTDRMPIRYVLSLPEPHTHLFTVQIRIDAVVGAVELVMPSWTPGSYLLREYARNVQDFGVTDAEGKELPFRKVDKSRWRIESGAAAEVVVRYRVYANELSVRTSHLDASHGYVNGASVFMYVEGRAHEEARVTIERPEGWEVTTSLREDESGEWVAADYDELVDCPIEIGRQRVIEWEQEGIPHRYAFWGPAAALDEERLIADTRRVIEVCSRMFGGLPYDRYLFLVHVGPEARGGLEHKTSTSLLVTPSTLSGEGYESLISLVAHEFFHVWLGKRIRPAPLGPFDYTRENYTRNLWVVEGFTTYYTDRILLLAGLMSPQRYLERLGDAIARHQELPGRLHQNLEESSFDAWIRFYRPDAHTPNSQVSYYQKGSLVAMAIDLEIRAKWQGTRSLDDVMAELWRRHEASGGAGFPEEGPGGIQEVVEGVYSGSVQELFEAWVRGVAEIDFERLLGKVGLRLVEGTGPGLEMRAGGGAAGSGAGGAGGVLAMMEAALKAQEERAPGASSSAGASASAEGRIEPRGAEPESDTSLLAPELFSPSTSQPPNPPGGNLPRQAATEGPPPVAYGRPQPVYRNGPAISPPSPAEARLGLRLREETGGRVRVTNVLEGTPAHRAGVNVGDEILAISGERARLAMIGAKASSGREGENLELLLMRRDEVVTLELKLEAPVVRRARIVWAEDVSERRLAGDWLGMASVPEG